MTPPLPAETFNRLWAAHGGYRSKLKPRVPDDAHARDWKVGDPVHWQEQKRVERVRYIVLRLTFLLQLGFSILYLQQRARTSIGVFEESRETLWYALQIIFFSFEVIAVFFPIGHLLETWNVTTRNCIDFKRIPNDRISPYFKHNVAKRVPPEVCNYPAIDVIIPCYKEDTDLVLQVVKAAMQMDYPPQLLSVYLCDDGKDDAKKAGVERLQAEFPAANVHYVRRPDNKFAKPGNVNYTLERTDSHLVVQLDADFIARPFLIQRLLPYYFVWNPHTDTYDFNETLAFVQTPQHYRNISPYDADVFDQRNSVFFKRIQPGRDWFNNATMVGTSNLINRTALTEAGNFPYHTKGDDIALSIIFHGLGYRSYHVNESVATGLVPTTLRGNFAQRKRWYTTDFEILFSRHGPFTQKGLTLMQRLIYFAVPAFRIMTIMVMTVDVFLLLVLIFGFSIVDVVNPRKFLIYLCLHLTGPYLSRFVECVGAPGIYRSLSSSEIFETIFRYSTFKTVFLSLRTNRMNWKTAGTDYASNSLSAAKKSLDDDGDLSSSHPSSDETSNSGDDEHEHKHGQEGRSTQSKTVLEDVEAGISRSSSSSSRAKEHDGEVDSKKTRKEHSPSYLAFVLKNLKRCWYNIAVIIIFSFALIWSVVNPPDLRQTLPNGSGTVEYSNYTPFALSFAYILSNLITHVIVIVLCFRKRYVSGWILPDLVNGRCDGLAEKKKKDGTKKPFVPMSTTDFISFGRTAIVVGLLAYTVVSTLKGEGVTIIPNDSS